MPTLNIDHLDALSMIYQAYDLLFEFQQTINNSLDGDHPAAKDVETWLSIYEEYVAETAEAA